MATFKHIFDSRKPLVHVDDGDQSRLALMERSARYRRIDAAPRVSAEVTVREKPAPGPRPPGFGENPISDDEALTCDISRANSDLLRAIADVLGIEVRSTNRETREAILEERERRASESTEVSEQQGGEQAESEG